MTGSLLSTYTARARPRALSLIGHVSRMDVDNIQPVTMRHLCERFRNKRPSPPAKVGREFHLMSGYGYPQKANRRLVGDAPNNNSCSGPPSKSAKSRSSQGCSERGSAKSLWSASALAGNGTTAWEDINAISSTAPCVAPPTAEAGRGSMLAPMLARFSEFTAKAGAGTEGALTTAEILATKAS